MQAALALRGLRNSNGQVELKGEIVLEMLQQAGTAPGIARGMMNTGFLPIWIFIVNLLLLSFLRADRAADRTRFSRHSSPQSFDCINVVLHLRPAE